MALLTLQPVMQLPLKKCLKVFCAQDLKTYCRSKRLAVSGTKRQLMRRLLASVAQEQAQQWLPTQRQIDYMNGLARRRGL
eukprot:8950853-Alexandrium_andersonii.AAC.1